MPEKISRAWNHLKSLPAIADGGFAPWIRWYEAAAPFAADHPPTDYFGNTITQKLLVQSDDWWKRGAIAVNADIAEWLTPAPKPDSPPPISGVTAYEKLAQSEAPAETIAAYRFDWDSEAGQITTAPPATATRHSDMAQDLLDELRRKAMALAEKLRESNADPAPGQSLTELLDILPEKITDLRPGLLLSRSRAVEADGVAFAKPDAELELFGGAVARIMDVARSAQDLQDCFAEIRDLERERRARNVQDAGVNKVEQAAEGLASAAAEQSTVVDDKARAALNGMAAAVKNARSEKLREELAGDAVLVQQNFLSTVLRSAVVSAVKDASVTGAKAVAGGVAKDIGEVTSKARDGAKLTVIAGLAGLVGSMLHPALGAIFFLGAMSKSEVVIKAADELLKSVIKKATTNTTTPTASPTTGNGSANDESGRN